MGGYIFIYIHYIYIYIYIYFFAGDRTLVLGCPRHEHTFLEHEGIFLLLDHIDTSGPTSDSQATISSLIEQCVLGFLLDLCENSQAVAHILAWKSRKDLVTTAIKLFLRVWRAGGDVMEDFLTSHMSIEAIQATKTFPTACAVRSALTSSYPSDVILPPDVILPF